MSRAPFCRLTTVILVMAGISLAGQQTPRPASPSRAVRTAAVSGVVIDGVTGNGVPGATVTLSAGLPDSLGTVTDSKGRFVFQNLAAFERCILTARKPGYADGGLLRQSPIVLGSGFALADGEWIADARIVLRRPGAISGRVVDEKGEPLVDVAVRVLTRVPLAGVTHWAGGPASRTDDRGFYRIPGLKRGEYIVSVPSVLSSVPVDATPNTVAGRADSQSWAFMPSPRVTGSAIDGAFLVHGPYAVAPPATGLAYPVSFYPGSATITQAASVRLGDSEERAGVDFALRPVPAVQISGRITGPPDILGKVIVRLLLEDAEELGAGNEQATALAGADGRFLMPRVPAGRYILDASTTVSGIGVTAAGRTPGLVPQTATMYFSWPLDDPLNTLWVHTTIANGAYSARLPVTVDSADVTGIALTLERGASISGRVVLDNGAPLPKTLTVRADPASGDPRLVPPERLNERVNADGTFTIDGLRSGEYFLRAPGGMIKHILAGEDHTYRPLRVDAGTDTTNVVITLDSRVAELSGSVRDAKGAIVRQSVVILFPAERSQWSHFGLRPTLIRAVTYFGDEGYKIPRLPGGEYLAIAVETAQQEAWRDQKFLSAASSLATRVALDWGAKSVQNLTLQHVVVK
jgi:hypothetical protein